MALLNQRLLMVQSLDTIDNGNKENKLQLTLLLASLLGLEAYYTELRSTTMNS